MPLIECLGITACCCIGACCCSASSNDDRDDDSCCNNFPCCCADEEEIEVKAGPPVQSMDRDVSSPPRSAVVLLGASEAKVSVAPTGAAVLLGADQRRDDSPKSMVRDQPCPPGGLATGANVLLGADQAGVAQNQQVEGDGEVGSKSPQIEGHPNLHLQLATPFIPTESELVQSPASPPARVLALAAPPATFGLGSSRLYTLPSSQPSDVSEDPLAQLRAPLLQCSSKKQ